ncbi:hypothetical protein ACFLW2_01110 [Chloroflexota bacterium]
MSEQKETQNGDGVLQEKNLSDEIQIKFFNTLIGKLHKGISQLSGEDQKVMLKKHAEASVEVLLDVLALMSGQDPRSFDVDEMIKNHEMIEKQFAKGNVSITRQGNIITWSSSGCYDPKIESKVIEPYPAYCNQCYKYFFKGLYEIAHKGPVKVKGLKSALHGDGQCLNRIELL